ncbi:MAG: HflK protein, partial [Deltaproteobacteria bacterium]|nr:HflK protein [Deltaproteobacteria bacterium]
TKIPKALGTAKKIIQEAEGYAIERVNRAEGDVARFNAILKQYVSAKEVTRTRMYVETLTNVLPNVRDIVVIDPSKSGMVPLLNLGDALSPSLGKKN